MLHTDACVQVDTDNGTWVDMPDGFPSRPKKRGQDYVITLRIPRFNESMFYDPIIDATEEQVDDTADGGDTSGAVKAVTTSIAAVILGLLLGLNACKRALWVP